MAFPPAGMGVGIYREWADALPSWLDFWCVCPPGREARLAEPPVADMIAYAEAVAEDLVALAPLPVALFGHSMGAIVACEAARVLEAAGEPALLHLFVSSHRPPTVRRSGSPHYLLDDEELLQTASSLWGGGGHGVTDDPEALEMALAILREDLRVLETHQPSSVAPLRTSIAAFASRDDRAVSLDEMRAWESETVGSFTLHPFAGEHRYVETAAREVTNRLAQVIESALRGV